MSNKNPNTAIIWHKTNQILIGRRKRNLEERKLTNHDLKLLYLIPFDSNYSNIFCDNKNPQIWISQTCKLQISISNTKLLVIMVINSINLIKLFINSIGLHIVYIFLIHFPNQNQALCGINSIKSISREIILRGF